MQVESTGWWTFAVQDASGGLVPSAARVGLEAPPSPAFLRPTGEALRNAYDQFGGSLAGGPRLEAAPAWATGSTNVLVILVQFPADAGDPNGAQPAVNASFTAAQVQANLFGGTSTGPGNMTDYYDEISFGNLNLVGTVVGPFTVANDKNDYDDGPSNAKVMVAEAIALADASVDFAPFDNDGNGEVDMVAIAYAGNGPDNGGYDGADSGRQRPVAARIVDRLGQRRRRRASASASTSSPPSCRTARRACAPSASTATSSATSSVCRTSTTPTVLPTGSGTGA